MFTKCIGSSGVAARAIAACAFSLLTACQGHVEALEEPEVEEPQKVTNASLVAVRPVNVPTDWQLIRDESYLSFISVKQTDIAEVNTFDRFDVMVSSDGAAQVTIDTSSVATGIDLRDQRLRDYLFQVANFPEARIDMTLDMVAVAQVPVGERSTFPSTATVSLHGMSLDVTADLVVMRLADDRVVVTPQKPIVLHATDFNMSDGIAYLIALAKLDSISSAVPVDFMFTLEAPELAKH